jgi:hypothetical protein
VAELSEVVALAEAAAHAAYQEGHADAREDDPRAGSTANGWMAVKNDKLAELRRIVVALADRMSEQAAEYEAERWAEVEERERTEVEAEAREWRYG